ncbi:MAG: polyamine aminopropyltransferase [Alphaproteobacteria bacterium]|nr:polyamine aminopropyltransferase [Alphaproteobacteria bacterium]
MTASPSDWFEETLYKGFRTRYRVGEILHETKTHHQHLVLFRNETFGHVLALNGVIQTTERDEFIYHEMLTHTPILAHGAVRNVLIIGGGDGGMLEEALKHKTVTRVTLVEIDAGVIEFSKQHLKSICGDAFDDPRVDIVIGDGMAYAAETEHRFDVVIVDGTDPIGPGEILFTEKFYAACKRCLAPGGVLVTQNGVPFMQGDELQGTIRALRTLFDDASCYTATIPTYVGGCMAFGWASDDPSLRVAPVSVLRDRFAAAMLETDYYTPDVHCGAFALPRYIERIIA